MDPGGDIGIRLTRNVDRQGWLGIEYGFSHRANETTDYQLTLGVANLRLATPRSLGPGMVFVTLGAGVGDSRNYAVSPMWGVGFGAAPRERRSCQRGCPCLLFRVEVQTFTRGRSFFDHGRFMVGFSAGFGQ